MELIGVLLAELASPLTDRFVGHGDAAGEQELFHISVAEAETEIQPDAVADDFRRKATVLITVGDGCAHVTSIAYRPGARQVAQQVDNAPFMSLSAAC